MNKDGPPPAGFAPPPPYSSQPPPTQHMPQYTPAATVTIVSAPPVGPDPSTLTCPHCQAHVTTRIETEASMKTHLIALLLCIFVCWPCAPCVYCCDSCLVKNHYCPNCGKFIGKYDS